MHRRPAPCSFLIFLLVLLSAAGPVAAEQNIVAEREAFLLGPYLPGPVLVDARFELRDLNSIDDTAETFEFAGVVTLEWRDPRQAFDPAAEGVGEKIYQGSYQFNEISPSWYPQLVPVNATGTYETNGVLLRVRADGTSTLIETLVMSAKAELDMRRFPFDKQRLVAMFEILGFSRDEVSLLVAAGAESVAVGDVRIPQWQVTGARLTTTDEPPSHLERSGMSSALILSIDVERKSWFARRLVVIPLIAIVLLSFSVFWMDRSSLGDRLSVSFIGILTAVTYQLVTSEQLPHISYVTLMHGFLSFSFLTMCATVVINLVVGSMDKRGEVARGDQIDRRCRWIFPLVYFGFILLILGVEYLEF